MTATRMLLVLAALAALLMAAATTTAQDPAPAPAPAPADAGNRIAELDTEVANITAAGMPMGEWLMGLAARHHFNLVLARGLPTAQLNLSLERVTLWVAIYTACESQGCHAVIAHNIVFVWPGNKVQEPPVEWRAFKLGKGIKDMDALATQVKQLNTIHGITLGHSTSRVLFVIDTADALASIARYIDAVETAGAAAQSGE
ncbi:MAG: hypothetical protein AB7K09_07245 [Planctomycetota bacterium]